MKDNFTNGTDPRRCIPRKISWWHLAYVVTLLLVVLICVIVCLSKESVSDAAMDNVSFASSIVSIVLAVVSIVVSLYATFSTSANLGSMQDVARGIRRSLNRLKLIKTVADDNNRRLEEIKTEMLQKATPEEIRRKRVEEQVDAAEDAAIERKNVSEDAHTEPPKETSAKESEGKPTSASGTSASSDVATQSGENSDSAKEQPRIYIPSSHEIADIESRAIEKVRGMLGLGPIMRDYNLHIDGTATIFDGVYESPITKNYTFIEVTSVPMAYSAMVHMRLSRFRQRLQPIFQKMRPGANHIYYVMVFRNNDKAKFINRLVRGPRDIFLRDTPYLTILYFNLDEL